MAPNWPPELAFSATALGNLVMRETLLLIEDSRFIRAASARLLTNAGFTVNIAGDGEEALRLVQENPPDLILLDMLLPKMGGAQVLQALKQDSVTAHIPVIVLSSLSQQNESKLKSEGAALYFEKSRLALDTGGATLVAAIERLLSASKVMARNH
jgi:CheY-like chemotaxis protein